MYVLQRNKMQYLVHQVSMKDKCGRNVFTGDDRVRNNKTFWVKRE